MLYTYANGTFGYLFVGVFFILSGAMLYYNQPQIGSLRTFYYKRWKAIYPMFYLAYLHYFLQTVFSSGALFYKGNKKTLIWTVLGLDGYIFYKIDNYYILGEWFLGAIILLYVLYPLLLWLFNHWNKAFGVMVILLWIWQVYFGKFEILSDTNLLSCIVFFVGGMYIMKYKLYEKRVLGLISLIGTVVIASVKLPVHENVIAHVFAFFVWFVLFFVGKWVTKSEIIKKMLRELSGLTYAMFLLHHRLILQVLTGFMPVKPIKVIILSVLIVLLVIAYAKVLTIVTDAVLKSKFFKRVEGRFLQG